MKRKANNSKIISGIILILACFSLMACENGKLSLSSSIKSSESAEGADVPKLADSTGTQRLAESQEDLAQEDAEMEEDGFNSSDSSDFLERYCGVEKKAEQTLAVFAREAREEGEEKQKFQKQIESEVDKEIEIQIHFKNLQESRVEDVWLKAEIENAELEYIPGSTIFYTSAFREGKSIDDGVIEKGINIGNYSPRGDGFVRFRCKIIAAGRKEYGGNIKVSGNVFDGRDYQADWASIYTKNAEIQMEHTVRLKDGEGLRQHSFDANIGDVMEFCVVYTNDSLEPVDNVVLSVSLPNNMEYVPGSTRLVNQKFLDGAGPKDDTITTDGINIGNYESGERALVKYSAVLVDKDLVEGTNRLINWAKISAGGVANLDYADVYVSKEN
jgi:conserved repeat protein